MLTTFCTRTLRGAVLLIALLPAAVLAQEGPRELIVVGDSLSDAGNLAALPQFAFLSNPLLPYDDGFSNGPRAVEVLAEDLGLAADPSLHLVAPFPVGTNFAVAGARSVTLGVPPTIDLPTQVSVLLLSRGGVLPADALYVVFIGGNDIRDAVAVGDRKAGRDFVDDAAAAVEDAITALLGAGARTLLVANAPDIGGIPEVLATGDRQRIQRATKLTRRFNKGLRKAVRRAEKDFGVDIAEFDTFRFLNFVVRNADRLGFTNTTDACFETETLLATGVPVFHPDCTGGANFDAFVYFDEIHPSARVHALVGAAMLAVLAEHAADDDDDDQDRGRGRRGGHRHD